MINFVHCSKCGKQVSNAIDVDHELFIRAWIECPECIDKQSAIDSRLKEAVEEIQTYKNDDLATLNLQWDQGFDQCLSNVEDIIYKYFPELKEVDDG